MSVTQQEYSALSRFLKRRDGYHWLQFDQYGYEDVYFNVKFDLEPKQIYGDTIGFTLKMDTDSPYGYSREIVKKFSLSASNSYYKIVNNNDSVGKLYPFTTITPYDNGNIIFTSGINDDKVTTQINNVIKNQKIILDGDHDYFEGISNPNDFNYQFPILDNKYDDKNTFFYYVTNSVGFDIELQYRYTRMVIV